MPKVQNIAKSSHTDNGYEGGRERERGAHMNLNVSLITYVNKYVCMGMSRCRYTSYALVYLRVEGNILSLCKVIFTCLGGGGGGWFSFCLCEYIISLTHDETTTKTMIILSLVV